MQTKQTSLAPPLWRLPPAPHDPTRKCAGVVAVLLLHLVAALALLQASLQRAPALRKAEHEITFWFLPPPKPKSQFRKPPQTIPRRKNLSIPLMRSIPDLSKIFIPQTSQSDETKDQTHSETLQGLRLPLLTCAPENLDRLSPEARAKCASIGPLTTAKDSVDYADHSDKSKDADKWARGKARKNAPMLLPCANSQGVGVSLGTLACLANGAINGFDLDAAPSYVDRPSESHVPNGGDPPPLYRDPDH